MNTVLENKATQTEKGIQIERVFNAPRQLVWDAWTKPEHMKMWWGPKAYTAPVIKADVREGGKYHYCMRSNEGQDIWSTGTFIVVDPISRLEMTDSFADAEGNVVSATHYNMPEMGLEFRIKVSFEDHGSKTKMTLIHEGLPAGEMSEGAIEGWSESLDKLEAIL